MVAGILLAASLTLPVCEVVERADREMKTYPGVVKAIARVDIVPQVCAEVLEVCFEDGASVCKGDVLYRLDSVRYVAEVKNAEAKMAECKASLAYARQSYERHRKLLDTRAVSQEAVDNALAQRDTAEAGLAAAEAELVVARDHLRHCTITAPFDGRMGTAVRRVGSFVMDDPDTWPLVDLVQTDPIRVRFALSNGDYLRMFDGDVENLRSNAVVEVILPDGRAYERKGAIEYVENVANRRTDTSPVYIRLPNSRGGAERRTAPVPGGADDGLGLHLRRPAARLREGRWIGLAPRHRHLHLCGDAGLDVRRHRVRPGAL